MLSVVIPAYNEEELIGNCLNALVTQNTKEEFEVILVNNNSTDKTADIAREYKSKLNLKILLQKEKGRGAARHKGFTAAKGDIILSTDADTVVPSMWVERLSDTLKKSNAVAVSGTCRINDCGWITNNIVNLFQPICMIVYRLLFNHYWLSGFNFVIYKQVYERSGGFNSKLNAMEDIELAIKVSKIGKIKFIPNLPVIFSGRRFQKSLIKGLIPYLTGFLRYYFQKKKDIILSDVR